MNTTQSEAPWPGALARLLGVEYPILQGPFGGFRSQALTAAVSNFGALGSLGANALEPNQIRDAIAELRSLTDKPFAVNLWVSTADAAAAASDRAAFERSLQPLAAHFRELGAPLPLYQPRSPFDFEAQARAVLDAKVPVFSFICGVPPAEIVRECRVSGTRTIATATTPDEAEALERAGVDAIVASGFEAGGHRGSFLRSSEDSLIGTFALVPQIADVVSVPVIAAGGIADARGVLAAFALGASGVQIGTALLACEGSGASSAHRDAISAGRYTPTGLSRAFTGRLARGVENELMRELQGEQYEPLPYPLQRALIKALSTVAEPAGRNEWLPMWSGQSASLARKEDAATFLRRIVTGVAPLAGAVLEWQTASTKPE